MRGVQLARRKAKLVKIGRFDASSKARSRCGSVKHDLALSDCVVRCDVCGLTMDRDLNAAINVLNMGLIRVGKSMPEFARGDASGGIPSAGRHYQRVVE